MDTVRWSELVERGRLIVESIGDGIFRLTEQVLALSERSCFYLVQGDDIACMIDGGWGFCADIPAALPTNGLKLIAAATHSHYDHIGCLHVADERLGHRLEAEIFSDPRPDATQALPFLLGRPVLPGGGRIEPSSIRQAPCALTACVEEGSRIELGGRHLSVLHTPGHSPGSVSFLDSGSGTLFCGDVLLEGEIYDDIPGADRAALLRTHRRLERLPFRRLCAGHGRVLDRPAAMARMEGYRRSHGGVSEVGNG
jgi:glyoxylase-like metal-dependent hydrolase (beta-lactamase superfamily II)